MASFGVRPLDVHNATVSLFERHGFGRTRPLGKNRWVVTKVVRPRQSASPT